MLAITNALDSKVRHDPERTQWEPEMTQTLDIETLRRCCDRLVAIRDGQVVFQGSADELLDFVTSDATADAGSGGDVICTDLDSLNAVWNRAMKDAGV